VTLLVTRDIILLSIEMNNWNVEAWLGLAWLGLAWNEPGDCSRWVVNGGIGGSQGAGSRARICFPYLGSKGTSLFPFLFPFPLFEDTRPITNV
jgi:hypothetical protein